MDALVYFWVWDKRFSLFLNIDHTPNRLSSIWLRPFFISVGLTGYSAALYWWSPAVKEGCTDQELSNLLIYFFGI